MKETGIYYKYVDNLVLADVRIVKNDQRFCLNHILKTDSSGVLPEDWFRNSKKKRVSKKIDDNFPKKGVETGNCSFTGKIKSGYDR